VSINWVRTRGVVGGREDTVIAGQAASRVIVRQRNSTDTRVGVKWSQVRILSPLPCDVSRHRNSPEPALGSGFFPFGAFGGAGGLVILCGVQG
jgi:hypothetical protein